MQDNNQNGHHNGILEAPFPVGMRVRFKLNAELKPQHHYLRGTPLLILGDLRYMDEDGSYRQHGLAFDADSPEHRCGYALPRQLEMIPDDPDGLSLLSDDEITLPAKQQHELFPSGEKFHA